MNPVARNGWLVTTLVLAVVVSAIAAIYARHQARKSFVEFQALVAERDRLEMDWGRLQIEHSTWANHSRVEQLARDRMSLRTPGPADMQLVQEP